MDMEEKSEKLTVELPPGWHGAMQKLSEKTGVSLKYLYTLAVDRLLSDPKAEAVEEAAWDIERRMRKDLQALGARHTANQIAERYTDSANPDKKGSKRKDKKD